MFRFVSKERKLRERVGILLESGARSHQEIELEVKFKDYKSKGHDNINSKGFTKALNALKAHFPNTNPNVTYTESKRLDYKKDIRRERADGDSDWEYIIKERFDNYYNPSYPLVASLSKETDVGVLEYPKLWGAEGKVFARKRVRYGFKIDSDFRLDLTEITQEKKTLYEIELEYTGTKYDIDDLYKFDDKIEWVMKIVYDTKFLYTFNDFFAIVNHFNSMGPKIERAPGVIDSRIAEAPRNLHFDDLVDGGIINNTQSVFMVNQKIDGERRFLMIKESSFWFIHPPTNYIDRVTTPFPRGKYKIMIDRLNGTILDGELVKVKDLKFEEDKKNQFEGFNDIFYVFDILSVTEDGKVTDRPFATIEWINGTPDGKGRYNVRFIENLGRIMKDFWSLKELNYRFYISKVEMRSLLSNKYKGSLDVPIKDDFFVSVNHFLRKKDSLVFETDGLIFMPVAKPYGNIIEKSTKKYLSSNPEICKWKPNITVDLTVKIINGEITVFSLGRGGVLEDFVKETENDEYLFMNTMLDHENPFFNSTPDELNGKVVEFEWDKQKKKLAPFRLRKDKLRPNGTFVAKDNWKLMQEPITEKALLGEDDSFLRYYHRRIIETLHMKSIAKDRKNSLLDLNAMPASVRLWKRYYSKVIALLSAKPSDDMLTEIGNYYSEDVLYLEDYDSEKINTAKTNGIQLILVKAKISETEKLTKIVTAFFEKSPLTIASFYEMNRWWKGRERFKTNVKTLSKLMKNNNKFIYLEFNGDNINPDYKLHGDLKVKVDGEFIFKDYEKYIEFNADLYPSCPYKDCRVRKTHLDDLIIRFKEQNVMLLTNKRCDGQRFINRQMYILSSLFNFGMFSKMEPVKMEPEPQLEIESELLKEKEVEALFESDSEVESADEPEKEKLTVGVDNDDYGDLFDLGEDIEEKIESITTTPKPKTTREEVDEVVEGRKDTIGKEESKPEVIFQIYSRSADKPPGKGSGEQIDADSVKKFTALSRIKDWRKKLFNAEKNKEFNDEIKKIIELTQEATVNVFRGGGKTGPIEYLQQFR